MSRPSRYEDPDLNVPYKDLALEWCNEVRQKCGRPPIPEMPKGGRAGFGLDCPLSRALGGDALVGTGRFWTDRENLLGFIPRKRLHGRLPFAVQCFVSGFARGLYPELTA
jgi:hypothetical protein